MADRLLASTPVPVLEPITEAQGMLTATWLRWFGRLPATLAAIPSLLNVVRLSTQSASITAIDFSNYKVLPGVYRLTYSARISRAASVSSSLTVTLAWTDAGVAQSFAGAAMVGNTTATVQSQSVMIRSDSGAAITYATTYASVGGTTMQYQLDVAIEKIAV